MKRLNFGCGSIQPVGWDNVDILPFGQEFRGGSQLFADNTYDYIVAHCTLQIIEWHDLVEQLKDLHRILKLGGVIRISLPDIETGFKMYENGNMSWFPNGEEDIHDRFSAWLTWYSTSKTLLTRQAAYNKFREAGFEAIMILYHSTLYKTSPFLPGSEITDLDTREHECYFFEAMK